MLLSYLHWNISPEIITIFGFPVRYYGLLFAIGIFSSIKALSWAFRKESLPQANLDKLTAYGIIGIIVGARLGHCLFYEPGYYLSNPLEILLPIKYIDGEGIKLIGFQGLASHGGVLGLLIGIYFYSRKTNHSMLNTIDLIAIVSGLGFGFIRLANFMNSEIIGIPTTKPWGVIFERVDNIPRHPAQLYEAISYFIIFVIMIILYKKKGDKLKSGFFFGLATVLFFTARILIEFIKENQVGFEDRMTFNMGQILSLPYMFVGIGFIIYGLTKTRKSNPTTKA